MWHCRCHVPVADNVPGGDMPKTPAIFGQYIRTRMPKKGRGKSAISIHWRCPLNCRLRWKHSMVTMKRPIPYGKMQTFMYRRFLSLSVTTRPHQSSVYDFIGGFEHTDGDQTMFTADGCPSS